MSKTDWNHIEVKQAWDHLAEIAEEQMIYFNRDMQIKTEKAISTLDKYINKN